ncbi:hypothetical protein OROGR_001897 [Orobanche gracilis]
MMRRLFSRNLWREISVSKYSVTGASSVGGGVGSGRRWYGLIPMVIGALVQRGTRLRHILAVAQGAHNLYQRPDLRRHCSRRSCSAPFPRVGEPFQTYSYVSQFAWRSRHCCGLAIYDTMQYIRSPINTICLGQAASMASLLLTAAGAKGERRSLPNTTIMIHQPSGGYSGQAKDISIHTKQIIRVWDALNDLYCKHTGQPLEIVQKNMDRDYFMTPQDAKEFGIIDEVFNERPITLVADAVADEAKDKGSN